MFKRLFRFSTAIFKKKKSFFSQTNQTLLLLYFQNTISNSKNNMHLMYYLSPEGKRIYTLKKVSPSGRPTVSAHPARFSPDDKYSRHRITCKRRYGLLPTQKPATQYWNFLLLLLLLLHPTISTFTSSRLRLANRTWISSRSIPSSYMDSISCVSICW